MCDFFLVILIRITNIVRHKAIIIIFFIDRDLYLLSMSTLFITTEKSFCPIFSYFFDECRYLTFWARSLFNITEEGELTFWIVFTTPECSTTPFTFGNFTTIFRTFKPCNFLVDMFTFRIARTGNEWTKAFQPFLSFACHILGISYRRF